MITALLDTNIYDLLERNAKVCERIRALVEEGSLQIVLSRTVREELLKSPFGNIPDFFHVKCVGNTVAFPGIMCAGDSLGAGEVFVTHLGNSTKRNDALVADAAACHTDWLVTEDKRLRKRFAAQKIHCKAITFEEFIEQLPENTHNTSNGN